MSWRFDYVFEDSVELNRWGFAKIVQLSLPIHTVAYEDMVDDLESTLRGVLDFLGLDWHPGWLPKDYPAQPNAMEHAQFQFRIVTFGDFVEKITFVDPLPPPPRAVMMSTDAR